MNPLLSYIIASAYFSIRRTRCKGIKTVYAFTFASLATSQSLAYLNVAVVAQKLGVPEKYYKELLNTKYVNFTFTEFMNLLGTTATAQEYLKSDILTNCFNTVTLNVIARWIKEETNDKKPFAKIFTTFGDATLHDLASC